MKNGVCPKCGGNEIIRIPGQTGIERRGNIIPIGISAFTSVYLTRYVCSSCGFSEEWVDYPEGIERLKKKFGTHIHQNKN
ncbi:MAG: hypothetical protein HYZ25_17780 [Chloroflexi bacterium]|nr:hypothetical protein [Chloroflexota bacterium]